MKINCIIIDDEPGARFILRKLLEKLPDEIGIAGEASSLAEARPLLATFRPNLVFLDLEMIDSHGFELFENGARPEFEVVITSAHADQALDAFGFGVADYLVKPINTQQLSRAVSRVKKIIAPLENSRMITFHTMEGTQIIPSNQIVRLEADRNYSWVYGSFGKPLCISKNLGSFEGQLLECGFFRVHHSHLISLHYAQKLNRSDGWLEMKDGQLIPVSRERKKRLLELLESNKNLAL